MQDIAEEIQQAGTYSRSHVAGTPDRELRIEIRSRFPLHPAFPAELARLGISVREQSRLLRLSGVEPEAEQLSVLADPLAEAIQLEEGPNGELFVDVFCRPGVTDAEGEMATQALAEAGIPGISCRAGTRFRLEGAVDPAERRRVERLLGNPLIHELAWSDMAASFSESSPSVDLPLQVKTIELIGRNDAEVLGISHRYGLALDLEEMRAIAGHYAALGRNPTDVELQSVALAWSEHCSHKTFRAPIELRSGGSSETIPGLLRTYLIEPASRLQRRWVRSAFIDNAGIIAFDRSHDLAIKVETHNHPSALEPFGGAHTGVGGVIRDVLAVSAEPIANTDVLCFGPLDLPDGSVPAGAFHPATTFEGVVRGIADYGNNMGIPTVGGAVLFHPGYTANPLVYCGTVGIAPRGSHPRHPRPGDLVVLLGGRTGRDGLNGATMSSATLDRASVAGSTVQIGAPIVEKTVRDVIPHLRDERLYHAITDCGAGGLCSAVGEMGEHLGVEVELERVPLKYQGLAPWEIWLSEAQERMVLAVPPSSLPRVLELCRTYSAEATAIGRFRDDGLLLIRHEGHEVGRIETSFLHGGCPVRTLEARWEPVERSLCPAGEAADADAALLALLSHPTIASKENVIRRYDHEVQAATIVKPLCGRSGPSDGTVLRPISGSEHGVALAHGINPLYGELDPHAMAMLAVDEALRNLVAAGGSIDRAALLDNFCWGDVDDPVALGELVRAVQGCRDAMEIYGVPFISGKDSLRNTSIDEAGRHSIPGTLLVTALGVLPDVGHAITMDLKAAGNRIYLLGQTRDELGGSHYRWIRDDQGGTVPQVRAHETPRLMRRLTGAIRKGLIRSCHDLSEGGLAVAAAEMAIAGGPGLSVDLGAMPTDCSATEALLFAESPGRFLVEVDEQESEEFERLLTGLPAGWIGVTTEEPRVVLRRGEQTVLDLGCDELGRAWRGDASAAPPITSHGRSEAGSEPGRRAVPHSRSTARVRALVLAAPGINCDRETVEACDRAGARVEAVHLNQLLDSRYRLGDFGFLVLPGGFSYGDHLGAGAMLATILRHRFMEDLSRFIEEGRPVLGICNGFQVLARLGLLGDMTLIPNVSNRFECRWVPLRVEGSGACGFLDGLDELELPIAHGQGRVVTSETLTDLLARAPLRYRRNPNGSVADIAGVSNAAGNVLGLMPHPERYLIPSHHPGWTRSLDPNPPGLTIFQNAIRIAESL